MQAVNEIIDELMGNDSLKASPYVWHKLCEIKELSAATPEAHIIKLRADIDKDAFLEALKAARNDVTFLPPENARWIPVTERLPKDTQIIIVTRRDDGTTDFGQYNADKNWCVNDGYWPNAFDFVAWMPLPEPYTEEE